MKKTKVIELAFKKNSKEVEVKISIPSIRKSFIEASEQIDTVLNVVRSNSKSARKTLKLTTYVITTKDGFMQVTTKSNFRLSSSQLDSMYIEAYNNIISSLFENEKH